MGWASGRDVFDGVAGSLLKAECSESVLWTVLKPLIGYLQDQDWDTEDESLMEFRDNIIVRAIFYSCDIGCELDLYPEAIGRIDYNEIAKEWCLTCEDCGDEFNTKYAEFTAEGHDSLIDAWGRHARKGHDHKESIPSGWYIKVKDES